MRPPTYQNQFREGGGLPEGTLRLFWLIMDKAFKGLFNGSERMNALELTKRLAWAYGGVAVDLGLPNPLDGNAEVEDYDSLVRFPNLSSIAAARFARDQPEQVLAYWRNLRYYFNQNHSQFSETARTAFYSKIQRPFQLKPVDYAIRTAMQGGQNDNGKGYNGVMFTSKWLADDMGLQSQAELGKLREIVDQAHRPKDPPSTSPHFGNSSPSDWWAIVLADGDSMGKYVSGKQLHHYCQYVTGDIKIPEEANATDLHNFLENTRKRMGPATHVGLNRALLDFSNRLVPYLTETRYCGRVIYSGGDDVMAILPLEDLPEYLLSLKAAWCGSPDPIGEDDFKSEGGYWCPQRDLSDYGIPNRPHFTMGKGATMSMGIVIAHKSVPLPTVLENLWEAEGKQAKGMAGQEPNTKNGLCFRVIYSSGNRMEALMPGHLLQKWWGWVSRYETFGKKLSPVLYRLSEELPQRASFSPYRLFSKAAAVLMARREDSEAMKPIFTEIEHWLNAWEAWATQVRYGLSPDDLSTDHQDDPEQRYPLGSDAEALGKLLRFTAFWLDKRVERLAWQPQTEPQEVAA